MQHYFGEENTIKQNVNIFEIEYFSLRIAIEDERERTVHGNVWTTVRE